MTQFRARFVVIMLLSAGLLAGCFGCAPVQAAEESTALPVASATSEEPRLPSPIPATSTIVPTATMTAVPEAQICSPFAGWDRVQLIESISNPFHPPATRSDDPHQGVDFSDLDPDFGYAREGLAVYAVLAGRVAGVIADRFPYGNAVVIETTLDDLPAGLAIPEKYSEPAVATALTCPPAAELTGGQGKPQALYLLYAHLQEQLEVAVGDSIECGQPLGNVGGTGNALAPHLHLEARAGPAGQQFTSMAHYMSSASETEMANYCVWRVSGQFPLLDPMMLIERLP